MSFTRLPTSSSHEIAIHCPDKSTFESVVELLQANGLSWGAGVPKKVWLEYWNGSKSDTCVSIQGKLIAYSRIGYYQSQGAQIINFSDLQTYLKIRGGSSSSSLAAAQVYSQLSAQLATSSSTTMPPPVNITHSISNPFEGFESADEFEVDDVVTLIDNFDKEVGVNYSDRNPKGLEGKVGKTEIIDGGNRVEVLWSNGHTNGMYHTRYLMKKSKKPKEIPKLDESKLEPLIIDENVKKEIAAVLKQHEHSVKIFEEWGLGEVIEYGRGMTFMFYGPPGTGKTWGATCIAKAMGRELLIIGAAEIQSQEPGGANRNIQAAFAEAKKKHKLLFIDECDSLITSRADVGMILGSEINTLLTEIEKFEGVLILATNRIDTMDEALERRISLIVEFPEPDFNMRQKIWETLLPKKMPIDKTLTTKKLAEMKLTGGQIKNCILQAARLAVSEESHTVEKKHFERAISRVMSSKGLMGATSRYRQDYVKEIATSKIRGKN